MCARANYQNKEQRSFDYNTYRGSVTSYSLQELITLQTTTKPALYFFKANFSQKRVFMIPLCIWFLHLLNGE